MARIILVHGSMHGGWCWAALKPLLERRGHRVFTPDLPGSRDELPPEQVSLRGQTDAVLAALEADDEPAVLVGHSLGGMAVSMAAEARPDLIRRLIYLCALLPIDGESAAKVLELNEDQSIIASFQFRPDGESYVLPPENRRRVLYHDCPEEIADAALGRLVSQSTRLMQDPVRLTFNRFGSVPKLYLETADDRALGLSFQRAMTARYPAIEVRTLECAHSPFYACPETLAEMLDEAARMNVASANPRDNAIRFERTAS